MPPEGTRAASSLDILACLYGNIYDRWQMDLRSKQVVELYVLNEKYEGVVKTVDVTKAKVKHYRIYLSIGRFN